jgi:hypothetical protein
LKFTASSWHFITKPDFFATPVQQIAPAKAFPKLWREIKLDISAKRNTSTFLFALNFLKVNHAKLRSSPA